MKAGDAKLQIKYRIGKILWTVFRSGLIIGVSYVILYPLIVKLSVAFMSKSDMYDMTVRWLPKHATLDNFKQVIDKINYWSYFFTTFGISAASTVLQVAVTTLAAYGFARFKFKGRNIVFILVLLTLVVPPQTYIVSSYSQFRFFDFFGLGALFMEPVSLINTPLPQLILSFGCLATKNGLFIYLMRQFFRNLPLEIEESAWVDGAGVFRTFISIMLPNAVPALTTITVFSFVWNWNDLYAATTYMPSLKLFPIALSNLAFQISQSFGGRSNIDVVTISMLTNAGALLILLPMIVFFFFAQRFFIEGVERTGITGQ